MTLGTPKPEREIHEQAPLPLPLRQNQSSKGLSLNLLGFSHFGPQYVLISKLESEHIVVCLVTQATIARFHAGSSKALRSERFLAGFGGKHDRSSM